MMDKKEFFVIKSDTVKAQEKYIEVENLLKKKNFEIADKISNHISAIVVIGGDGEMLRAIQKYYDKNLPFIGINAGSVGFLMNEKFDENIFLNLSSSSSVNLNPLEMTVKHHDGIVDKKFAFNEVSIYRASNQACKIEIQVNEVVQLKELIADGIIISTSAGSSAYNFSAGGRIIPLDSKLICLTPVCPFRPRRWAGAIIPSSTNIRINISEHNKRPVNAVADFNELENVVSIEITERSDIFAKLIFSSFESLNERIIKEQFIV